MDKLEKQREYRRANGNACTKRYEKTKPGFLMRLYRNMESRVTGIQKKKHHLYSGKYLLPREEFYKWAWESPLFLALFIRWENSDYDRKLTPTVDRINSSFGYTPENMEWVTHSENSRRGAINKKILHGRVV